MKRAFIALAVVLAAITLFLSGLFIFSAYWAIFQPGNDDAWLQAAFFSLCLSVVFGIATILAIFGADDAA